MSRGKALPSSSPTIAFPKPLRLKLLFFPLLDSSSSSRGDVKDCEGNFLGKAGRGRLAGCRQASQTGGGRLLSQLGLLTHSLTQASSPADSRIKAPVNFKKFGDILKCCPHTRPQLLVLDVLTLWGSPDYLQDLSLKWVTDHLTCQQHQEWSTLDINEPENLPKDAQVHPMKFVWSCNLLESVNCSQPNQYLTPFFQEMISIL